MCVMSHFVISYRGDRSVTMSITMMEVAMKTGGWERGAIQINTKEEEKGEGLLHKSLSSHSVRVGVCVSNIYTQTHTHS